MDRLVPAFIIEQYAAGNVSGRFPATALFVDISEFSKITNALMEHGQHGAEVLATTMRATFEPLVRIVYEHGGFVTGFAGDGFTAIFAGSDHAQNLMALAAAWKIREQVRDRSSHDTPYGAFKIDVKSGLALGEVGWGIVTAADAQRASYYFQGTAVDDAAAAEQTASAGEIVLNPELAGSLASCVEGEAAGQQFRLVAITVQLPAARPFEPPPLDSEVQALFVDRSVTAQRRSGEFRQVVNVLMSLPTVRTAAQLAVFTRTLFDLQARYGGLLSRLDFGDKGAHLLLFWGAPIAYENDIERALNFVLDLQAQTAIPFNAGITYRIAHAGYIGGEWRNEYTCYGEGINLAARFMTSASRGEIWADENVVRRAGTRYDFDFAGEMTFKGFPRAQKVFALVERKEEVESFYDGMLVGRERELRQLADFVEPLFSGRSPGMALALGEPGIGKSRLLHAFHASLETNGEPFLRALCQTDEILRTSLNPFRYWLRHYFGISAALSEARNKRTFNRKLDALITSTADEELVGKLDQTRSFLGALVGLEWPDSLYEAVDAEARYENTFIGLIALLRAESLRQPVIIFLEDAQWLDEDSEAFLTRLLKAITAGRKTYATANSIAVVAAARPEEGALSLSARAQTEISLSQLDGVQVANQVEALLGGPVAPGLQQVVAERAEGNPFFAEQLVRYLQDEALLHETPAGWDVIGSPGRAPLPADIRAVLVARLDQLVHEVREVVETASVLGREFEVRLLSQMLGHDPSVPAIIEGAARSGIWTALADLRYLFKHALLRDTAYRTQVRARRQALHAQAVAALERLFAGDLGGRYGELAYHAERGMLPEKARQYLRLAGDHARAGYHNALALDFYGRALLLTPDDDLEARFELQLAQDEILSLLGKQDEREETLQLLLQLARTMGDPEKEARALLRRGRQASDLGHFSDALALLERAVALAREADALSLVLSAQLSQAMVLQWQGQLALAAELAEKAVVLAEKLADPAVEARAFNVMGMICVTREMHQAAEAFYARGLASIQATGDRRTEAQLLNNLGGLVGNHGDYGVAQRYYEQALRIVREIGERNGEGILLANLGWVASATGEVEEAQGFYHRALRIAREVDNRSNETFCLINLSACLGKLGDENQARVLATEALQLARETGERSAEAWALTYLGHARLSAGLYDPAIEAYEAALAIRRELAQSVLATEPAAGAAAAYLAIGDIEAARASVQEILPELDGGILEGTDDPFHVYYTAYQLLAEAGDPEAEPILTQAYDLLQARAERISDESVRQRFLGRNPSHRALRTAWDRLSAAAGAPKSVGPTDGRVT